MAEPTEDIPYEVDDFATPDEEDKTPDPDQAKKSVLEEISKELAKDIAENNSFDVINTPAGATAEQKIAAFDDIAIHKGLALYLKKYKIMIDNKLKELKQMSDTEDDFTKAFDGFGEDPTTVTPPATPPADPAKDDEGDKPKEDEDADKDKPTGDKPDGATESGEKESTPSDSNKPADSEEKPGDGKETQPTAPETPQPLTKDDVQEVVSNLLNTERNSSKELETTANEVLEAYYPDGLSNVLIDEKSGKELRTPADVVEASGGEMSTDEATQWLLNEQFKLDKQVDNIKSQAKDIAETTMNFKRDSVAAVAKYEPLFKAYPHLQQKVFDKLKKQIKVDEKKGVILSSPDVMEHYDDYLEPYQQAFEFGKGKPATNPPPKEEPPKPTAEDRMDEGGDGGQAPVDDPTDFSQQVKKELAKGI